MSFDQFNRRTMLNNGTICEQICTLLQCINEENSRNPYENEVFRLFNILMRETRTYGVYIVNIYSALEVGEFASALNIGRNMLHHENMLHGLLSNKFERTADITQ